MHTTTEQHNGHTIEIVSHDGLGTVSFRFYVMAPGFKTEGYATMSAAKGAITKATNAAKSPHDAGMAALDEVNARTKAATSDNKEHASVPLNEEVTNNEDGSVTRKWDDAEGSHTHTTGLPPLSVTFDPTGPVPIPFRGEITPFGMVPDQASEDRIEALTQSTRECDTIGWVQYARTPNGDPIHADPRMAKIYAEMDYFGMTKGHDKRSRNKREGRYAGTVNAAPARYYADVQNKHCESFRSIPQTRKQRKAAKLAGK